jgi:RNA polymerase sigma-70 factor (ECF subfamily)
MRRATPNLVYLGPEDGLVSDEWLARAAAAGDMRALEELYRRYETPVVRYLQRVVRDNDTAIDLFQEAFFRAYVNLSRFDPRRSFRPWLYRVATNVARDWIRHESRALPPAATPAEEPSVISIVEARDLARRVADAVAELADDHRLVVILRQYQGLSYAEIAEITGSPEGTVRSRMHYALRALREKLRFLAEEEDDR